MCIHKRNTGWLLSICTAIFRFSSAASSLFVPTTPQPFPSKTLTPKLNSRVRPCFWSSQILYPTSCHPRSTLLSHRSDSSTRPLAYPHHQHAISCRSPPILRQNWSPGIIVPWLGSRLVTCSAIFLLLRGSGKRSRWFSNASSCKVEKMQFLSR